MDSEGGAFNSKGRVRNGHKESPSNVVDAIKFTEDAASSSPLIFSPVEDEMILRHGLSVFQV